MKIAYVNTYYKTNHTGGGHVHMGQFIANATKLGHEIWAYRNNGYPNAYLIPTNRIRHIQTMRKMDVLYVRLEHRPPNVCYWSLPPRRTIYGFPIIVWEFNTTPEEGLIRGESQEEVKKSMEIFRKYGRGCDLAVCMTRTLAEYVNENLGIMKTLVIPNGSDPDLFYPSAPLVKRMIPFQDSFNIVWIGSAKIVYHDFDMLRETARSVWDRAKDKKIYFHIIGPDMKASMSEMPPNVFYWGAELYEKMPNWLSAMHVGLYLTRGGPTYHSTPLKLFDYMASGLTVVSTSQPHFIRELFSRLGQVDLLVEPGDSEGLAETIIKLEANRERVRKLGEEARKLVVDRYNWKQSVVDTMTELEKLLAAKRKIS